MLSVKYERGGEKMFFWLDLVRFVIPAFLCIFQFSLYEFFIKFYFLTNVN